MYPLRLPWKRPSPAPTDARRRAGSAPRAEDEVSDEMLADALPDRKSVV